jgi:S-(hydroxymethyl)glutathione dehydrogenase/alcohol dehydrogenase
MKTKAAVIVEAGKPFEIEELDLDGPGENEVLIRYTHAGLCHSDLHVMTGDFPARLPWSAATRARAPSRRSDPA